MEDSGDDNAHEYKGGEGRKGHQPAWDGKGETGSDLETSTRRNLIGTKSHGWICFQQEVVSAIPDRETSTYKGTKYEK